MIRPRTLATVTLTAARAAGFTVVVDVVEDEDFRTYLGVRMLHNGVRKFGLRFTPSAQLAQDLIAVVQAYVAAT